MFYLLVFFFLKKKFKKSDFVIKKEKASLSVIFVAGKKNGYREDKRFRK